ncbi:MAG: SH3 domain-containing protein [Chloroflexota bacterium]
MQVIHIEDYDNWCDYVESVVKREKENIEYVCLPSLSQAKNLLKATTAKILVLDLELHTQVDTSYVLQQCNSLKSDYGELIEIFVLSAHVNKVILDMFSYAGISPSHIFQKQSLDQERFIVSIRSAIQRLELLEAKAVNNSPQSPQAQPQAVINQSWLTENRRWFIGLIVILIAAAIQPWPDIIKLFETKLISDEEIVPSQPTLEGSHSQNAICTNCTGIIVSSNVEITTIPVHIGPNLDSHVTTYIPIGEEYMILDSQIDGADEIVWYQISQTGENSLGWIREENISLQR